MRTSNRTIYSMCLA